MYIISFGECYFDEFNFFYEDFIQYYQIIN